MCAITSPSCQTGHIYAIEIVAMTMSTLLEESSSGVLKKGAQELKQAQAPGGTKVTRDLDGTKVSSTDMTLESC